MKVEFFVILLALIASYVLKSIFKSTQNHLKTLCIFSPKLTCSFPEKCILSKSMFVCVQIQQKSFLSFKTSTKCWRKKFCLLIVSLKSTNLKELVIDVLNFVRNLCDLNGELYLLNLFLCI